MVDMRTTSSKSSRSVEKMDGEGLFAKAYNTLKEQAAAVNFNPSSSETQLYAHFLTDNRFIPNLVNDGLSVVDFAEEIKDGHLQKLALPAKASAHKPFMDAAKDIFLAIKADDSTKLAAALAARDFLPSNTAPALQEDISTPPASPAQTMAKSEIESYLKSIETDVLTPPDPIVVKDSVAPSAPAVVDMSFWDGLITKTTPPVDPAKIEESYAAQQNSHMGAFDDKPVLATTQTPPDVSSPEMAQASVTAPTFMSHLFNQTADKPPAAPAPDAPVAAAATPQMPSPPSMDTSPTVDTTVASAPQAEPVLASADKPTNDFSKHKVSEDDESLWKIARIHYGLDKKDTASIQKAVETIAQANGMEGLEANKIKIGQILKLPDNPFSATQTLDWAALDKDSGISATRRFNPAAEGQDIQVAADEPTSPRPQPRPEGLAPAA